MHVKIGIGFRQRWAEVAVQFCAAWVFTWMALDWLMRRLPL